MNRSRRIPSNKAHRKETDRRRLRSETSVSKGKANHPGSIERVYAHALLELSEASGQPENTAGQLQQLGQVFETHPRLLGILSNRMVSVRERLQAIDAVFRGRVDDLIYRFLQVVNKKGRLGLMPGIILAYAQLLDERNGVVQANVGVAVRLTDDQLSAVADRISAAIGRNVVISQQVDPQLIGGIWIRVGDRLIDGCVATQLRLMQHNFVMKGHERARSGSGAWTDQP